MANKTINRLTEELRTEIGKLEQSGVIETLVDLLAPVVVDVASRNMNAAEIVTEVGARLVQSLTDVAEDVAEDQAVELEKAKFPSGSST